MAWLFLIPLVSPRVQCAVDGLVEQERKYFSESDAAADSGDRLPRPLELLREALGGDVPIEHIPLPQQGDSFSCGLLLVLLWAIIVRQGLTHDQVSAVALLAILPELSPNNIRKWRAALSAQVGKATGVNLAPGHRPRQPASSSASNDAKPVTKRRV